MTLANSQGVLYQPEPERPAATTGRVRIATKNDEKEKNIRKLTRLSRESEKVIMRLQAVFPFNFFPDEVIIDEAKVSVIHKIFFFSRQIRSIAHEDIFNVVVEHSILFATLEIADRYFIMEPLRIPYLKKDEAIQARKIIQGIIIAKQNGIDLAPLDVNEIRAKIEKLGEA